MHHDNLAIDDGLTGNVESGSDGRETLGPVETVAGVDLLPTPVCVNLDAVTIILDTR